MNASLPILPVTPALDPAATPVGAPAAKAAAAGTAKSKDFPAELAAAGKQSERKPAAASPADLAALGMPLPVAGNPPPPSMPAPVQPPVKPPAQSTPLSPSMASAPFIAAAAPAGPGSAMTVPPAPGAPSGPTVDTGAGVSMNPALASQSVPKPGLEPPVGAPVAPKAPATQHLPAVPTAASARTAPPASTAPTTATPPAASAVPAAPAVATAAASAGRGADSGTAAAQSAVAASLFASVKAKAAVTTPGTSVTPAANAAASAAANAAANVAPPAVGHALAALVATARAPINPSGAVGLQDKPLHAGDAAALAAGYAAGASSTAAALAAGPAPVASASGGNLPSVTLTTSIHSQEFPQALADRVTWIVDQNLNGASLQVNPPHLGPIELRVSIERGHADISMSAHNAATVAALQSSAPKLRELLGAQGFGQVTVDVSQRSFQDRPAYSQSTPRSFSGDSVGAAAAVGAPSTAARARVSQGSLDAYA